jgi:hypothetical protein
MAREDRGSTSNNEDELKEATLLTASTNTIPPPAAAPTTTPPVTGAAKKLEKKRCCERAQRKTSTLESLQSSTLPTPTPQLLDKATQSEPIHIKFAADNFRATKLRWTG